MFKTFLAGAVLSAFLPVLFAARNAAASSTYDYNCQAAVQDPQDGTVWFYELHGLATFGEGGFVAFQKSPLLSLRRSASSDPRSDETDLLLSRVALRQDGFDHGASNHLFFLLSLPTSVFGLRVSLDTITNEIYVHHKVSPDKTIESNKPTQCQLNEVG